MEQERSRNTERSLGEIMLKPNKEYLNEIFLKLSKLGLSAINRKPEPIFYEEWLDMCQRFDVEEILLSWNGMKLEEPFNYYSLKAWKEKLLYHSQDRRLVEEQRETHEYSQNSENIADIRKKANDYFGGTYTRQELINMGVADQRTIMMWESARYPLDKPPGIFDTDAHKKELRESKYKWVVHNG